MSILVSGSGGGGIVQWAGETQLTAVPLPTTSVSLPLHRRSASLLSLPPILPSADWLVP